MSLQHTVLFSEAYWLLDLCDEGTGGLYAAQMNVMRERRKFWLHLHGGKAGCHQVHGSVIVLHVQA